MNSEREVFICECCDPKHQFVIVKYSMGISSKYC